MYSIIELTTYVYRAILQHLVDFEERKNEIVNDIYCEPSVLRDDFNIFLDNYLKKLEELIKTSQIIDRPTREKLKSLNYLPYVIIGSTVELESNNEHGVYYYRIVSPYDDSKSNKDLSYISTLGRALMLKRPGDIVENEINKDVCSSYHVKSIRYEG
ncbi:GreA/GreB family elongation factor [Pseudobacteroides cellulosolvens]|uniref:GreA/GreB family elongation factor n=1 Tax=Pseudobacteroides cellulosolvens ATCC 35603 = DSM 2933 TaxID=398512 RepID=A0A0L6JT96_9FIRM|nr:GreA/GreB family elongation factor [Pseudobacteroides cellulosolvens]KNY28905.1 GreA/GreB family elongation factor [Pseudobacteroides cellulosolvens ATCC 35603 = DSM 2933]